MEVMEPSTDLGSCPPNEYGQNDDINHSKEPHTDSPAVPEAGQAVADGAETAEKPCCCCAVGTKQAEIVQTPPSTSEPWVVGTLDTPLGIVPKQAQYSDRRIILDMAGTLGYWPDAIQGRSGPLRRGPSDRGIARPGFGELQTEF